MYEPSLVGEYLPTPRVQVTFSSLNPSTRTVTVWRVADVTTEVPGAVRVFAAGGFTVADLWAPHSVEVSYYAEMFSASGGSLGRTGTSSVTVWGERSTAWFSDPFDPENAIAVDMDTSFGESLQVRRDVESYNVGGRVVSLLGNLSMFRGVDFSVKTDTIEQAEILAGILRQSLVLIRCAPYLRPGLPTVLYATVDFEVVDADHLGAYQFGGEAAVWKITGDQNSPVTVGAAVTSDPWQSYIDAFATWAEMDEPYSTWLDAMRNPPGE